jgi:hypothetical protein
MMRPVKPADAFAVAVEIARAARSRHSRRENLRLTAVIIAVAIAITLCVTLIVAFASSPLADTLWCSVHGDCS